MLRPASVTVLGALAGTLVLSAPAHAQRDPAARADYLRTQNRTEQATAVKRYVLEELRKREMGSSAGQRVFFLASNGLCRYHAWKGATRPPTPCSGAGTPSTGATASATGACSGATGPARKPGGPSSGSARSTAGCGHGLSREEQAWTGP
jgi:hypothetical protein